MWRCLSQAAVARPAGPAPTTTTGRGQFGSGPETAAAEDMAAIIACVVARAWARSRFPITVCYSRACVRRSATICDDSDDRKALEQCPHPDTTYTVTTSRRAIGGPGA